MEEARASFRSALEVKPDYADAYNSLGNTYYKAMELDRAIDCFHKALEIKPDFGVVHTNLGVALLDLGRLEEAEASLRRALEVGPIFAETYSSLGITLQDLGRLAEAEASFRNSLKVRPDYAEAHNNLGNTLNLQGRLEEAADCYRMALELKPDYAEAYNNLGCALKDLGRLDEAEVSYRQALEIWPDYDSARSNLLFTISYMARHLPSSVHSRDAYAYGERVAAKVPTRYRNWLVEPRPERLRVGVVSGDLRDHPVGYFMEGLLAHLDPSRIELVAYASDCKTTQLTARIKPYFSAWRSLLGLSDEAAAALIRADGIHILLDLAGHSAKNRLPLFAWKPAPVQATWLGYWATTGVAEIDYIIADATGVPPGNEGQFTEKVWRLPDTRMCFTPPREAPEVSPLPALDDPEQIATFGCFQILPKVNDETLALWGRVFRALPGAKLRWQCNQFCDRGMVTRTLERLAMHGIASSRVRLFGKTSYEEYLAAYAEVDAILDTFPFPGGTTTCEALWMGVPTLTLSGGSLLARQGTSFLTAAGLGEWTADSEDDFVDKAVSLVGTTEALVKLAALRGGLRQQVAASPLFDCERFAKNWEEAMQEMWNKRQDTEDTATTTPEGGAARYPADRTDDGAGRRDAIDTAPTFLHVGCGPRRSEWGVKAFSQPHWRELRLDIDPSVEPDIVGTMLDMSAVPDGSVDAVYSSHNIEHLYPHEVPAALKEFRRVLKSDGFIVITCPDLQSVCQFIVDDKLTDEAYLSPAGPIAPIDILYGYRPEMENGNLYMAHRSGFTEKTLICSLQAAGFSSIHSMRRGHPFYDLWALASLEPRDDADMHRLSAEHLPI